jgi:hypothetical protein
MLSFYTCHGDPSNGGGGTGSARRLPISVMCSLITSPMNMCLNLSPMSALFDHLNDVRMLVLFLYDLAIVHLELVI